MDLSVRLRTQYGLRGRGSYDVGQRVWPAHS
jgi:hypothetical protein